MPSEVNERARLAGTGAGNRYEVRRAECPVSCPPAGVPLWSSHRRVFLPLAESGKARCPYCGTEFVLID